MLCSLTLSCARPQPVLRYTALDAPKVIRSSRQPLFRLRAPSKFIIRAVHSVDHSSSIAEVASETAPSVAVEARKAAARAALDLQQRGWTSIEGVVSADECKQYVDSVWQWLESLSTGIKRDDPTTWSDEHWPPTFKGIINVLEVAHQEFVWKIRSHPKVLQVFQHLWGTTELLSSFDSINVLRPGSHVVSTDDWLHCDQAPHRRGVACLQGLVNMVDVGPHTGTLLVKEGSHAAHEEFFANVTVLTPEQKAATADFYQFQPEERKFYQQFEALPLSAGAGSLFLWDSRTAHQNVMPASTQQWRHVVYCCYQPKQLATEEDLNLKRQAWDEYRITTHWPAQNVSVFPTIGPGYYTIAKDDQAAKDAYMDRLSSFQVHRSRQHCQPVVPKLAGVEAYSPDEVQTAEPLIGMSQQKLQAILES